MDIRTFQITDRSKPLDGGFISVSGRTLDRLTVGDELKAESGSASFTVYQIDAFGKEVDTISPFADCTLILEGSATLRDGDFLVKR